MDPARWQKVKSLLELSLEVPTASRSVFLAEQCGADNSLRGEVEALLEFQSDGEDILESSAYSAVVGDISRLVGSEVDRYRIIREIGSGGMGSVFLAERSDGEFEQKAAVKIIKTGAISDAMLRRFRTERQILAALEHPNIAHLVDGGTTADNRPYLVMEYVEGSSITQYAAAKDLSVDQRLELFREVCSAVSFAHQKLVIHRDLKPSNILVTDDGKVKLLDFGIAKLLNAESSSETRTQAFAFTPDYASPEQICGEELSTATDVYSLGVVLFELLTGSRPHRFEGKGIAEIIRTVTDDDIPTPSAAITTIGTRSAIRGDLDNITLKALRKEPERRYRSVDQLSEDISRHLKGLPVSATKDTWSYRASKFIKRHRIGITATALIILTLAGGLATTVYQSRIASAEREKAERRFNDVRQLANSFMFEINEQMVSSPIKARELLAERAVEYLDKLAAESEGDNELESELATAYEKIGDIQSELFKPSSGKTPQAIASHQKSLALRQRLFAADPSLQKAIVLGVSWMKAGDLFVAVGRLAEAKENYSGGLSALSPFVYVQDNDLKNQRARILARLGQAAVRSGALSDASRDYELAIEIYRELSTADPTSVKYRRNLGIVSSYRGFVMLETGRPEEAVRDYGALLEAERQNASLDPNNIETRGFYGGSMVWYAVALSNAGQIRPAIEHFEQGIKIQESILAADPENVGEEYGLADCRLELGKALVRNEMFQQSIKNLELALAGYRKVSLQDTENLMTRHRIANAQLFLADALFRTGAKARALENYEQAHAAFKELTGTDPQNVDWQHDFAMSYRRLGEFALDLGDKPSAVANLNAAEPIFDKLAATSPENVKRQKDHAAIKALLNNIGSQTRSL